jgi:hypothetical protein
LILFCACTLCTVRLSDWAVSSSRFISASLCCCAFFVSMYESIAVSSAASSAAGTPPCTINHQSTSTSTHVSTTHTHTHTQHTHSKLRDRGGGEGPYGGRRGEELGEGLVVLEHEVLDEGQLGAAREVDVLEVLPHLHHRHRLTSFLLTIVNERSLVLKIKLNKNKNKAKAKAKAKKK